MGTGNRWLDGIGPRVISNWRKCSDKTDNIKTMANSNPIETFSTIETIITIAASIISGVVASIVTVFVSHKHEKDKIWWEKKTDEYQRIIRELAEDQNRAWKWEEDSYVRMEQAEGKQLKDEEIEQMRKSRDAAVENIRITAMVGSFYISQEAVKALEDMLVGLDKLRDEYQGDDIQTCGDEYELIKKTITRIRECGKIDLGR